MREILQTLFPYLLLLYAADCVRYVRGFHVLFVAYWGNSFRMKAAGFRFADISPLGTTFLSHDLPLILGSEGIYFLGIANPHPRVLYRADDYHFIAYLDIDAVACDGEAVKINGKEILRAPSTLAAHQIVNQIDELRALSRNERPGKLGVYLERSFALEAVKERKARFDQKCEPLKYLCSFLFFCTFCILPVVLYTNLYVVIDLHVLFFGMILSYIVIFVFTLYLHNTLLADEKKGRLPLILSFLFSPLSAMHIASYLGKDMLYFANYATVAGAVLSPADLQKTLRKELFLADFFKSEVRSKDWTEAWDLKQKHLTRLIDRCGVSREALLSSPAKEDEKNLCYCPFCSAQYTVNHDLCPDCGAKLKRFSSEGTATEL